MGEELLQDFINFCLNYMAKIKLPKKRYTDPVPASIEDRKRTLIRTLNQKIDPPKVTGSDS